MAALPTRSGPKELINRLKLRVESGTEPEHKATVGLLIFGSDYVEGTAVSLNGVVDAIFDAIRVAIPNEAKLEDFHVQMVGKDSESEAQAEVRIQLSIDGRSVSSKLADPDTLVASAKAYLVALNKLIARGYVECP